MMLGSISDTDINPLFYRICCLKTTGEMICEGKKNFGTVKKQIESHENIWIFTPNEEYLIASMQNQFSSCALNFVIQKK
jgi:hypothetical protein